MRQKNYNARSSSGASAQKGPSLAEAYGLQLSHFHQVRALCDMSMEQQVREYLNHCSQVQVPLVPPLVPQLVPPLPPVTNLPLAQPPQASPSPHQGEVSPNLAPPNVVPHPHQGQSVAASPGQQSRHTPPAGSHHQQQQQQQAVNSGFGVERQGGGTSSAGTPSSQGGPSRQSPHTSLQGGPPQALSQQSPSRVLSRNANGTIAMTSQPSNESELQLYRVLQRANLLAYFDTFICQGGDDVQQLCEAGEEEFLEIMALVGMASKPLHVRRLQKALQEWVQNPAMFQSPLVPGGSGAGNPVVTPSSGGLPRGHLNPPQVGGQQSGPGLRPPSQIINPSASTTSGLLPPNQASSSLQVNQQQKQRSLDSSNQALVHPFALQQNGGRISPPSPSGTLLNQASLDDAQVSKIAEAAEVLVRSILPTLSPYDIKNMKKRIPKEMEFVLTMSEDDPRRMEEIRKFSAIYAPTSNKRKSTSVDKALLLQEVAINEAAAQICRHIPALLSRKDELFPLARQVVRDCGYQFAKTDECPSPAQATASKRARVQELGFPAADKAQVEDERRKRQERLEHINEQLRSLGRQQEDLKLRLSQVRDVSLAAGIQQQLEQISQQQMQLLNDQNDVSKQLKRIEKFMNSPKFATIAAAAAAASTGGISLETKTDTEDTDSQLSAHSYSNNSSPPAAHAPVELSGHRADSPPEDWNKQKKTSQQITKQLVQETLMDEGLRVIKELANQIRGCAETETEIGLSPVAMLGSSPSPMMPLSLTCGNKAEGASTGRPRGRPPRLDRGDFVGTSRTISGSSSSATPPPPPTQATTPTSASPLNMSRGNSNSPNATTDHSSNDKANLITFATNTTTSTAAATNDSNMNITSSNGHHKANGLSDDSSENSLKALLALSQKGMLKQEPGSPAASPAQQGIKI